MSDDTSEDEDTDRKFYMDDVDLELPANEPSKVAPIAPRNAPVDRHRDQDVWETSLLMRSGAARRTGGGVGDDHEEHTKARILVKSSRPAFAASSSPFGGISKVLVDVVRDRSADLAKAAERGSQLVRTWKEKTAKNKMRQKYWELGGTEMGKLVGETKDATFMDEDDDKTLSTTTVLTKSTTTTTTTHESKVNQDLPISKVLPALLRTIRENQIVIVVGETGSGKTTRLPIALHRDGTYNDMIACTQPRRVAAMSVAKRVADESGSPVGSLVGYTIRFEDCTSAETKVRYMTDGVLLRESLNDATLEKYSCVVMDEAHERSLNTDVLFGVMKSVVRHRRDFRLIVTSATLDADRFSDFFGGAAIFRIPGRTFKVESYFTKIMSNDYVEAAVKQILQIHLTLPPGDILVFMTGQEDITCTCEMVAERLGEMLALDMTSDKNNAASLAARKKLAESKLLLLPMYSTLPSDLQSRIFDAPIPGQRKCVVSTNIAETSLTVDGIRYVVDCGFTKTKVFNPKIGMDALRLVPISRAAANQRSGRAGRTAEGYCYRLFTEEQFNEEMYASAVPEIQRTNLGAVILLLKSLGVERVHEFEFMDPPPIENFLDSLNQLWILGAVNSQGDLTALGRRMVEFPLDPALSRMLLFAKEEKCTGEVVTVVSMLSVPDAFFRPADRAEEADQAKERFVVPESDHLTLLNVYNQWVRNQKSPKWCAQHFIHAKAMKRALEVREQLVDVMTKAGVPEMFCGPTKWDSVRRSVCSAYFANSACLKGVSQYVNLLNGVPCFLHPSSGLFGLGYTPEYVVYHELTITTKEYMRHVTSVDAEWLAELGPLFFDLAGGGAQSAATAAIGVKRPVVEFPVLTRPPARALLADELSQPTTTANALQLARDKRNKKAKTGAGWIT